MAKRKSQKKTKKNINSKEIAELIRSDVLMGINDPESLSVMYRISTDRIEQALRILDNDPDIKRLTVKETIIRSSRGIPDNIKQSIANDYESGEYLQKDLIEKYGVSKSAVSNIIKALVDKDKIEEIKQKHINERAEKIRAKKKEQEVSEKEEVDNNLEENNIVVIKSYTNHTCAPSENNQYLDNFEISSKLTEIDPDSVYKTVGLINHRHNLLGVSSFVYDKVPPQKVLDFEWLENVARSFVLNTIQFNDSKIPQQGLIVKCTGLQPAIMSITKICYQLKVNLIMSHHQMRPNNESVYRNQPIFTDFLMDNNIPYILLQRSKNVSRTYLYNSDPEDYKNINKFYELMIFNKDESSRNNKSAKKTPPDSKYNILATSLEDIVEVNAEISKNFLVDRSIYRMVNLNEYIIDQLSNNENHYNCTTIQHANF